MNAGVLGAMVRPMLGPAMRKLRELPPGEASRLIVEGITDLATDSDTVTGIDLLTIARALQDAGAELQRRAVAQ